MRGRHEIIVRNRRLEFDLEIERNITILTGESATGKTSLSNLIRQYEELGRKSGVTIQCDVPCRVLEGTDWEHRLSTVHDSILFTDEGQPFIRSEAFAKAVEGSDNFFVLITREGLPNLPYSVKAILELKKTTSRFKRTYNRAYPLYEKLLNPKAVIAEADFILTEDSNAGYQFFSYLAEKENTDCSSSNGKSNIPTVAAANFGKRVLIIADGAAIGSEMRKIYELSLDFQDKMRLYLPESFEWILLQSNILHDREIQEILQHPQDYIDGESYFSWERYFTQLLIEKTKDSVFSYSKKQLNSVYLLPEHLDKIVDTVAGQSGQ